MNILFLTTGRMESIEQHAIYPDLLRCFRDNGHDVYTASTYEKRIGKETEYIEDFGTHALHIKIGNLTKSNLLEKGISTLMVEHQFKRAIRKYLSDVKFDLVVYSTPPITLASVISYVKNRDGAKTYLLLKDIFPQNAVDLGMIKKRGVKSFIFKYFRKKEKMLYRISDFIGCMSKANVDYILKHNSDLNENRVEICPNCVDVIDQSVDTELREIIRTKYDIPIDKKVFIYGGNLGKPQGISFLIDCLDEQHNESAFFLIVGDGTEYKKIENFINEKRPQNVKLMRRLPKDDYDAMVGACDVGMIFLDHRFTIPNFPSRLLAYMQAKIPILAVTDPNSDIGNVIVDGGFGWWCESNSTVDFCRTVNKIVDFDLSTVKNKEFDYLVENYSSNRCYDIVMNHF